MRVRAGNTMKRYGIRVLNADGQLFCPMDGKPCNEGQCVTSCWLVDYTFDETLARYRGVNAKVSPLGPMLVSSLCSLKYSPKTTVSKVLDRVRRLRNLRRA